MTATATAAMTAVTATPTYSSADLYLSAHRSLPPFASSSQRSSSAPLSLSILLSGCSTLPPVPPDFPRSKLIPSTRFVVDGFRRAGDYSVSYFLSHFHYDHYSGLSPSWSDGVVFCSEITARLLVDVLGVPSCFVVALPLDKTVSIDGCDVNLIDANHCPGAVQFLINVPQKDGIWAKYIHTGDFRFCESMKSVSRLSEFIGCDAVFLDTTYCHPKFMFPSQEESVDYVVSVIDRIGAENREVKDKRNVLFVVATYVIGKEKILVDISRRCGCKIFVDNRKRSVLRALGYVDNNLFTADESATNVRVVGWNVLGETWPYFRPNFVNMKKIMEESGYAKIVGFVPTGWTYEVKRNKFAVRTKDSFEIHLVPYSEHSNYEELREYIRFLKPKRVIPTVGLDIEKVDSKHVMKMQKHFAGLVDETANKHTFLMGFKRTCTANDEDKPIIHLDVSVEDRVGVTDKTATGPSSSASVSPASKCSTLLNEEEKVDILQQLHDCLPVWVTRDLMLELIDMVGTNVVEIVSYFYEHETELHDQIKPSGANTGSLMGLEDYSVNDVRFTKSIDLHEVVEVAKIQKPNLLLKLKPTTGSVISPKKRKGNQGDKAKKKTRSYSDPKASGIKQSTITTFFTKMQPCATQHGTAHPVKSEFPEIEDKKPIDVPEQYKEELEQLMCITNGSNASRSFAARAIVKARGDINLALDIYYSGLECKVDDNDGKVDPISKPVLSEGCQQDPCLSPGKVISEAPLNSLDRTVKGSLEENTEAVALPLEKYSQVEHACWRVGQPAPYLHLARTFELVEGEKGRIKASSMLCNMFRSLLALAPEDVLPAAYLCTNKLAADHENMELNIGGNLVSAALEDACGTSKSKLKDMYDSFGDLGDVAQECRHTQSLLVPPSPLLIKDVFSTLHKISLQSGNGSTNRKKNLIVGLMRSCREKEIKYLVRTLVRNLRIGAMMKTILPALAQAVVMNSCATLFSVGSENCKEMFQRLSAAVVEAYNIVPDLDVLIPSLLREGVNFSSHSLKMVPGIPIKPMLAKITNGIPQVLKSFKKKAFTCEYKYDGQRAQIHKLPDGSVHVFSRNGDETTQKFPDVVHIIQDACKPSSSPFVLDAEVVAVDRKNGFKLLSFQLLSSRERGGKGSSVAMDNIKVDVCVYLFDAMLVNGEQLLDCPLRKRRKYLIDLFPRKRPGYLEYANELTVEADDACEDNEETMNRMNAFFENAFQSSCEGIMVKTLDVDAGYYPSKRADTWLKVKRDYVEGLIDSLDLVPIGAWYGNGRKAGWYSPFLMACYNPDTEEFESVCRVMSGFSDSFYIEMKDFFSGEKILTKKPPYYRTNESPDKWFSPELVWQIKGADVTVSPVHQAAVGIVHPSRGVSVRFPRFIRSVTDRRPEDSSTSRDIAEMFHSQTRKMDTNSR